MAVEQYRGTGRRKTAVAQVRLIPGGSGQIIINKRPITEYFCRDGLEMVARQPFEITGTVGQFDVFVNAKGGGVAGQAGAVLHGIARALINADPSLRSTLKKAGFLRRDPRMRERKKYGQKGARARFQFSKR